MDGLAALAVEKARAGACVLAIANTVDAAQQLYGSVKSLLGGGELQAGLLHSRFPAFRREQLEELWIGRLGSGGERPRGCVLVSTQVVEQSVDIDADFLISELAPTDMLLQRLGRLWRHTRSRPLPFPEAAIFSGDIQAARSREEFLETAGASARVYAPYVLWRSAKLWTRDSILIPDGIREILEATYERLPDDAPDFVKDFHQDMLAKAQELRASARSMRASTFAERSALPSMADSENAPTRWGCTPQTKVLILRSAVKTPGGGWRVEALDASEFTLPQREERVDFELLKRIHRNLAGIQSFRLRGVDLKGGLLLGIVPDPARGVLLLDGSGALRTLDGDDSGLRYADELGVHAAPGQKNEIKGDGIYELEW